MKAFERAAKWLVLLTILVLLLFERLCTPNVSRGTSDTIFSVTRIVVDSGTREFRHDHHYYTREIVYRDTPIYLTREDSDNVVKDYFALKIITDSMRDSLLVIYNTDTITENDLKGRRTTYKLLRPVSYSTTTLVAPVAANRLYLGFFTMYGTEGLTGGGHAEIVGDKHTLGFGYDPFQKFVLINYDFKISFKRFRFFPRARETPG